MFFTESVHIHVLGHRLNKPIKKQTKLGNERERTGFIRNIVFTGLCKLKQSKCTQT